MTFFIGPLLCFEYGVIVALALLAGLLVSLWHAHLCKQSLTTIAELFIICVPAGLLGARLFYVFANWHVYAPNPLEIMAVRHGGLSVYGALIGAGIALYVYTKWRGLSFWLLADTITPGIAISHGLGQWGHFINQESFGYPTAKPWGIYIDFIHRPPGYEQYEFFHPIFLYQFGLEIGLFVLLITLFYFQRRRQMLNAGSIFLLYLFISSCGKFLFESITIDRGFAASITCLVITGMTLFLLTIRFRRKNQKKVNHYDGTPTGAKIH